MFNYRCLAKQSRDAERSWFTTHPFVFHQETNLCAFTRSSEAELIIYKTQTGFGIPALNKTIFSSTSGE